MTGSAMTNATRVMRSRKACASCGRYVFRGEQIALIEIGWCHVACAIARHTGGSWKDAYQSAPDAERQRQATEALS
jgi:hypothetical protein